MNVSMFDIDIDRTNILDISTEGIVLEINDTDRNRVSLFFNDIKEANRFAAKVASVIDNSTLDKTVTSATMESGTESEATNTYEFRDDDHVVRWYGGVTFEIFFKDSTVAEETFTYYGDHFDNVPSYEQARSLSYDILAAYACPK